MRDHSHHIEMTREEAVSSILELWGFPDCAHGPLEEIVDVRESFGRVLAADVRSTVDSPNVLQCMMDSIAVHWDDFADGEIPDTSTWTRGDDWEFANTGVAMPEGFDSAIVIEHVEVSDDESSVKISAAPSARYAGTKPVGSNISVGDILATAGQRITAYDAARIASGNVTAVRVRVRPKVAFIPTGEELVSPGGKIEKGRNIETNSLLVRGKVARWGGEPMIFDVVEDDPAKIEEALLHACSIADIVVLNAGSSKGSDDWCCEKLDELGEVVCHETNHGPGHHSSYAMMEGKPVVGISGPPAGASFTLDFYLRPLVMRFLGLPEEPRKIPVRLTEAFGGGGHPGGKRGSKDDGRPKGEERPSVVKPGARFFSIRLLNVEACEDGSLTGTPVPGRPGSPGTDSANAFYMLESGDGAVPPKAGDVIWVEMR